MVYQTGILDLLAYGERTSGRPAGLLVPAPIKRVYIWDLAPAVSVVRRCLDHGLGVYLLRWSDPAEADHAFGLSQYAYRLLADAVAAVEGDTGRREVVLAGHSLGGTLAAIFAAIHPEHVRALILLGAPLHFGTAGAGAFVPLLTLAPPARLLSASLGRVPGTVLDFGAVAAAWDEFVAERWLDRLASVGDLESLVLHLRVERWTLDELAVPGQLYADVVDRLYRQDAFMRDLLVLDGRRARPEAVVAPLFVVDPRSRVVPPTSVLPFVEAAASRDKTIFRYEPETGVGLQHVGPLVGRAAHRHLWPRILSWIDSRY